MTEHDPRRAGRSVSRARAVGGHRQPAHARHADRGHRAGARDRAADDQHRPAPPGHPRRAAAAVHAGGRDGAGHRADRGLRAHRHREELRGPGVLEGHPVRGADGLPVLLLQRDGLLQLRGDAAGRGGAAPRAVPARDPHGAEPDRQPPVLAGHRRAGPRRDVDAVVGAARARRHAGPVRDVLGPAHAHALLPGRRRDGGPPAGLGRAKCRKIMPGCRARIDQYENLLDRERDLAAAHQAHRRGEPGGPAGAGRDRPAAARRGHPVGPAQGDALQLLRPLRLQDPGGHRGRQLRPLPRAPGRDARVGEDRGAGAGRAARGAVHHHQPQGGAAAAARAGHLDGGADPPLQAGHRGLPRAARARRTWPSSPRAGSWAASWWPTARPSPRACTCATRRS